MAIVVEYVDNEHHIQRYCVPGTIAKSAEERIKREGLTLSNGDIIDHSKIIDVKYDGHIRAPHVRGHHVVENGLAEDITSAGLDIKTFDNDDHWSMVDGGLIIGKIPFSSGIGGIRSWLDAFNQGVIYAREEAHRNPE